MSERCMCGDPECISCGYVPEPEDEDDAYERAKAEEL